MIIGKSKSGKIFKGLLDHLFIRLEFLSSTFFNDLELLLIQHF